MSAEFSRPPVMEASLEDPIDEPGLLDRVQNVAADARVKLSRLAGAGLLVLGGTTAITAEEWSDPTPAHASAPQVLIGMPFGGR